MERKTSNTLHEHMHICLNYVQRGMYAAAVLIKY